MMALTELIFIFQLKSENRNPCGSKELHFYFVQQNEIKISCRFNRVVFCAKIYSTKHAFGRLRRLLRPHRFTVIISPPALQNLFREIED